MFGLEPPSPQVEARRLATLRNYEILDTPPEPELDAITELASRLCGVPIALVSLIDTDRQWFKSKVGLEGNGTRREDAFCAHAIWDEDVFVVPDATADPRFAENPFVTSNPHVRFYAGAPLTAPDGSAIGTLCVIDQKPRTLEPDQVEGLRVLARQVMAQIELRRHVLLLQEAHREMSSLLQLKAELVSMVSHELRTPLASIKGALQLIADDSGGIDEDEKAQLLASSSGSIDRLIRLTNDVLDLSKAEAGRLELRASPQAPSELIACAFDELRHLPQSKGRLGVTPVVGLPDVLADRDRIVQALVNLMANALKHTPPSAHVDVSAVRHRREVEFRVTDDGPGIEPTRLTRLFQPFEQLEAKTAAGGTGLGLAITKAIVAQHGGRVSVNSEPGKGTTFAIFLPLAPAPQALATVDV